MRVMAKQIVKKPQGGLEMSQELTGYASIDKPWLKYYDEKDKAAVLPKVTMYQMLWNSCQEHLDADCIYYYGQKISYRVFINNIHKTVNVFSKMGIKKGDIVTIVSLQTPETFYAIYALNYIGAAANLLYISLTEHEIIESVDNTASKALLFLDLIPGKAEALAGQLKIPVILLSVTDSMSPITKLLFSLKSKHTPSGLPTLKEYLQKTSAECTIKMCENSEATAVIVYTSGTTGSPKGVMLSNTCLNSVAFSCQHAGRDYQPGDKYLNTIPPFLGFGITMNHLCFCAGFVSQIVLTSDPNEIAKALVKYKSNRLVYGPRLADSIIQNVKGNLSYLKEFTGGGEAIAPDKEREINRFLEEHHALTKYNAGYGMTEAASVVSCNVNHAYKLESVGIPTVLTNVKVMADGKELPYNAIGELCFSSPSVMQGYYKNPQATAEVLETDVSGTVWLHSGDLGYVDEDGFIFITGRIKRIYTVFGKGAMYKLFPQRIEEFVASLPGVDSCAVTVREDPVKLHVATAFVVPADISCDKEKLISDITIEIEHNLPEYLMPAAIHIIDRLPLTTSGKVDMNALRDWE